MRRRPNKQDKDSLRDRKTDVVISGEALSVQGFSALPMTAPETALYLSREQIEAFRPWSGDPVHEQLCNTALAAHDFADRIAVLEAEAADAESELALTIAASSGFEARAKREIARAEKAEAELAARDEEISRLRILLRDRIDELDTQLQASEAARDEAVRAQGEPTDAMFFAGHNALEQQLGHMVHEPVVLHIYHAMRAAALPALPASEPSPLSGGNR